MIANSSGLGGAIRAARIKRGWSQTDLAQRSGVSRPTIARLEAGHGVSTSTLLKLATALDLEVDLTSLQQHSN
ncbi:helix-turn-helix domain-containing protein [Kocuria sp. CH-021]|uniref:helix-turn-helix domain-containing protein n=1 Tax=Kocuria sp. CH-021 TaxID=3406735 RepID=UPI003C71A314